MKTVISSIEIPTSDGENPSWMSTGHGGITRIEDLSQEYEEGMYTSYIGYDKDGAKIQMFENCPVIVSYQQVPDEVKK